MNNQKIIKSSTIIDRFLKIVQVFFSVGVIVSLVLIPLTAIFGQKIIADASTLNLGTLKIRLSGEAAAYLDTSNIRISIISSLLGSTVALAAAWYCIKLLREILVPMKDGAPFAFGISGKIRRLAWTVLVSGAVSDIVRSIASVFEIRAYHMDQLLNMEAVAGITYNITYSLWYVGAVFVLFFLSYIFRYGEALQKESDETL